ncbi:MAG: hypothetical protein AAFS01_13560 [Pseudomonadota bacterium]
MRPVVMADLFCAGRALLAVPPGARADVARVLVRNACVADRFRQSTGARHARFGDGTLAAAARGAGMIAAPDTCTRDFACALILVLQALVDHASDD